MSRYSQKQIDEIEKIAKSLDDIKTTTGLQRYLANCIKLGFRSAVREGDFKAACEHMQAAIDALQQEKDFK